MKFKILMLLTLAIVSQNAYSKKVRPRFVPGEILVKYKSGMSSLSQKNAIEREGAQRIARISNKGLARVKLKRNLDVQTAIEEFKNDPDVEYAQPNYIYHTLTVPNDPRYGQLWGLKNSGQTITSPGGPDSVSAANNPGVSGKDMNLEYAWNLITDCSSVVVAVLDTGINYNHSDLAANMWNGGGSYPNHGYNFVENTDDPMDSNGHGTHVAGTIGAVGNNGTGSTGVCWNVKLMAVRVLGATGSGTTASIVAGIHFAVDNGAKVLNMSLGGDTFDAAESAAVTYAQTNGVLIVAAAGNDGVNNDSGSTPSYPCNFAQANVVCVAALTQNYSRASFSNYGTTSVDIGAPGVNIVSSWPGTEAKVTDALTTGWNFSSTTGSGWGYKSLSFGGATNCLVNPTNYDYNTAKYANSTDGRAWKSFNLASVDVAVLNFYMMMDVEDSMDFVTINSKAGNNDPMTGGTILDAFSGSTDGNREPLEYDLTSYKGGDVSVGFNLLTNASVTDYEANISAFYIKTLNYNTTSFNVIQGTSMATPHVTGLAAMIFAYNPNYTYDDVANSIKNGGVTTTSMVGKTTTGKSASAIGSLTYISTVAGGAAVK